MKKLTLREKFLYLTSCLFVFGIAMSAGSALTDNIHFILYAEASLALVVISTFTAFIYLKEDETKETT